MTRKLIAATATAFLLGVAVSTGPLHAQEAAERERAMEAERAARERTIEAERAALAQNAESERTIAEARAALEQARRELEAAAREVARLSGRNVRPFTGEFTQGIRMLPRAMLGVSIADDAPNGVRVNGVTPGSAAAEAGVEAGDLITTIDGVDLTVAEGSASERLVDHMAGVEPGQDVTLRILRGDEAREIAVEADEQSFAFTMVSPASGVAIGAVPATPGIPVTQSFAWSGAGPNMARFERFLGTRWNDMELVPLTEELGSYFGTSEGLLVVRAPENDAIGLRDGDVILEIGGRTPATPEHALRILMSFDAGETLRLTVMRRERRETIEYTIPAEGRPG